MSMRIIILDDNPDALLMLASFLKTLDHQVHSFETGPEALLWLDDVKPQLIIADLDMPVMSGADFVKNVRARPRHAGVPVLCLTGTSASDEELAAHGFNAVLRKPITLRDLLVKLETLETELLAG